MTQPVSASHSFSEQSIGIPSGIPSGIPGNALLRLISLKKLILRKEINMSTQAQASFETITDCFKDSASKLIQCYTEELPTLTVQHSQDTDKSIAAIIGFGDPLFRGSVVILADESVAIRLAHDTPENPVDWLGELANQLVGRLKNKLAGYGVLPQMGVPVTVSGKELDLNAVGTQPKFWGVEWASGKFQVILSLEVDDALTLAEQPSEIAAEEGSLDLF